MTKKTCLLMHPNICTQNLKCTSLSFGHNVIPFSTTAKTTALDYCNSLFYGSPMYMLERLHKVQNSEARLIFQCRKQNHISPRLMSLHWLPIKARIEYKLSYLSLYIGLSPIYLSDLLVVYTPKRNLRSFLTIEFYVSLSCKQRHLGVAHFLLQPPQYGIPCLQCSDLQNLSRNLGQH